MDRRISVIFIICLVATTVAIRGVEHVGSARVLAQSGQDKQCGPRCLWALMQLTNVGKADCHVEHIYGLIGRPSSSPVNLKDLKDAAEKLGFRALGQKLSIAELKKLKGYTILPIGKTPGTKDKPQHFVLVAGVIAEQALVVDTESLAVQNIHIRELDEVWNGIALVIPTDSSGKELFRPLADLQQSGRSKMKIDFGAVEVGSKLDKKIVIATEDDVSQWKIIGKSCRCLEAKLIQDIAEQVALSIRLDVKYAGPQVSYVAVASEAAGIRKDYHLHVYGKNSHRISPAVGHLEVDEGRAEYPVLIEYFPGELNTSVKFDRIETEIPNLECGAVTVKKVIDGRMKVVKLTVPLIYTVTDASLEKVVKGMVTFRLNTSAGERFIPFEFSIRSGKPTLRITPHQLFMICSKSAASPIDKRVRIEALTEDSNPEMFVEPEISVPVQLELQKVSKDEYMLNEDMKSRASLSIIR